MSYSAYATRLGETTLVFHYPCGHTSRKDYSKGPKAKRLGPAGIKMLASWWSKENGGVNDSCPKCAKAAWTTLSPTRAKAKARPR